MTTFVITKLMYLITETWLHDTDRDRAWLCSASVNSGPLNILTSNRRNGTGGDLAIMYRKPLKGMTNTFKYAIWKVSSDSKTLDIIIIY